MSRVASITTPRLVGGRPGRFFVRGTVTCPACARPMSMLDLGSLDEAFRLQCDACGHVGSHDKTEVHVEVRRERRCAHRPF